MERPACSDCFEEQSFLMFVWVGYFNDEQKSVFVRGNIKE
jgi:hypothetical protein